MKKPSKRYAEASAKVDKTKVYSSEEAIKLAKVKSYNLVLGDYKINLLNRTLFMYLDDYITYEIYSINEDDNLFLIKFNQIYIIKEEMNVNITQSVIFYKQ